MQKNKAVIEYWQQGAIQSALMAIQPANIAANGHVIDRASCQQGKINDQHVLENVLQHGTSMLIVPYFARAQQRYFFPFMLQVDLDATGKFIPRHPTALPVLPNFTLESSDMQPIIITSADDVADYFVLNPPAWTEQPTVLTWKAQLNYAEEMLRAINQNRWLAHLESLQFFVQAEALILPVRHVYQRQELDYSLLKQTKKVEIISADTAMVQVDYAKRLIVDAWAEAAVKQSAAPKVVWLQPNTPVNYASIFDGVAQSPQPLPAHDLNVLQVNAHKEIVHVFNLYIKGRMVARNWRDLAAKIESKYQEQGGVQARIKQLQVHQKEAHARARHMQVLHSIWLRQVELVPIWSRIFDILPGWQQRRLHRLYLFFKQNFPEENVQGCNYAALEVIINDKLQRAKNSERFITDALHQTENDLRQLELVRDKYIQWAACYQADVQEVATADALLEHTLRGRLELATMQYWQVYFALHPAYLQNLKQEPDQISTLIVQNAEYISPIFAAALLAKTTRAVIMGCYTAITTPRFPVAVDFELAKDYALVEEDADYEDLQFDGISAALGNLWSLATAGREADKHFASVSTHDLRYDFTHVGTPSEDYYGSKINSGEARAIVQWLENNYVASQSYVIFTAFSGQAQYLRNLLSDTKYAAIPVRLLQIPCFTAAQVGIFSPVYSANDPGPYSFDRGLEIFANLQANVSQQIIVFGDRAIFKPELHSASGMFAKKIFVEPAEKLQKQLEVEYV